MGGKNREKIKEPFVTQPIYTGLPKKRKMPTFSAEYFMNVGRDLLMKIGLQEDDANSIVGCLVSASLRGVDSHGVRYLPRLVQRAIQFLNNVKPNIHIVNETAATALVDGDSGFGHVVGTRCMQIAIEKADKVGIGSVVAANSGHFGMCAYYSMIALEKDMIGIAITNTPRTMAPWGGIDKITGNNPISIAIPAKSELPIVVDISFSITAVGKIQQLMEQGRTLPQGWALDKDGNPTVEPAEALNGVVLPIGAYKGHGIAMCMDLLCGALGGGSHSFDIKPTWDLTGKSLTAHHFIVMNPEYYVGTDNFKMRVDEMIRRIKSSRVAPGFKEILLPGELEFRTEKVRQKEGIPISDQSWQELIQVAEHLGVKL